MLARVISHTAGVTAVSILTSLAITAAFFWSFDLPGRWPALMMAFACPALIAPPISSYHRRMRETVSSLNAELASANARLAETNRRITQMLLVLSRAPTGAAEISQDEVERQLTRLQVLLQSSAPAEPENS